MSLVIAVSGMPGSGSTTIARALAKRLNLDYYSPGESFKSFSKKRKETEAALDVWERFGRSKKFHEKNFDSEQMKRAKKGNIVICGKLSIHMLKNVADFKIWIDCDLRTRAARTAKRDRIPFEKAMREIMDRERTERGNWKRIYGFDYFDQRKLADFVLENSEITEQEALRRVLEFIRSKK